MAKITGKYETIFIVNPNFNEEETAAVVDKFKTLIEGGAEITKIDQWGKRRLAYPINDLEEGYYVFVAFTGKPDLPAELDRVYKITDGILRSIIVTLDD